MRIARAVVLALAGVIAAPGAFADPPESHEILSDRPSGFWTSNRPAEGGAYRYRLMLVGFAVLGVMGIVIWRVTKKK
jgi:hypothetical protein